MARADLAAAASTTADPAPVLADLALVRADPAPTDLAPVRADLVPTDTAMAWADPAAAGSTMVARGGGGGVGAMAAGSERSGPGWARRRALDGLAITSVNQY